jgi:surface carbohydrate biosynthesis protein
MNIYLHVEHTIRELDSKLLIAVLAASRGHQVIISDIESIEKGILRGVLKPGIFHTKSLTPGKLKIERHKLIKKKGSLITSIDEEAGVTRHGYDLFAVKRYSEETIKDSSAVFCWGDEDYQTLQKIYSNYSKKIHKTGSPRVDLWKSLFLNYWGRPIKSPTKPYLLVVSNMTRANHLTSFKNVIVSQRNNGYHKRNPGAFMRQFNLASEQYLIIGSFVEAIQHLANNNQSYDIVLRPHQNEDIDSWKIFLQGIPNVYVIRDWSITSWINNAFAIIHNGCTSALEVVVSKKPLITYSTFKPEHPFDLPNELGYIIKNKNDLLAKVNSLFKNRSSDLENLNKELPWQVSKKIYIDQNELSSLKIIRVWEKLSEIHNNLSIMNNWLRFKIFLKMMKLKGKVGRLLKKVYPKKFTKIASKNKNFKFPPLNEIDILNRVKNLQKTLGIKKNIKLKFLADRTILVKID